MQNRTTFLNTNMLDSGELTAKKNYWKGLNFPRNKIIYSKKGMLKRKVTLLIKALSLLLFQELLLKQHLLRSIIARGSVTVMTESKLVLLCIPSIS